ncbi:MFS transporter [Nonomuraea gerenzanensis]|uniref:Benzoate MFS transporter BenK n=1 Tax=Nonomuraea gerenzanensis TaxID=93944 RepID=A0A1M4EF23_9ACTN|nr:MFS transporter [Nonomuraea gerenzanensis]UBU08937.1 MFS transporter [Nonomuraea gerenzanensis]SBO97316.1 benzoate MFS transporter BenK [Nonomuraea gerenzanensis]
MSGRAGVRLRLVALLGAVGVANVAYTVLIPFVPTLNSVFQMSAVLIGVAFAGFAATKALSQPLGGWLVDRIGGRTIAIVGLAITALATAALAVATTSAQVVACRFVWGIGEGLAMPALYRLTAQLGNESGHGSDRTLGWFGTAAVAGMTVGPGLIAALSGVIDFRSAFAGGAVLTVLATVLVALAFRRTGRPDRSPAGGPAAPAAEGAERLARLPLIPLVLVLGVLDLANNAVYAALEPLFPLHGTGPLGAGERAVSLSFFLGLAVFAALSWVGGRVVHLSRGFPLAAAVFAVQAAALALAWVTGSYGVFTAAFVALMAVQPLVYVNMRAVIGRLGEGRQGWAFGWFGLVSDLGWVAGPLLATAAYQVLGAGSFGLLAVVALAASALGAAAFPWLRAPFRQDSGTPPVQEPTSA